MIRVDNVRPRIVPRRCRSTVSVTSGHPLAVVKKFFSHYATYGSHLIALPLCINVLLLEALLQRARKAHFYDTDGGLSGGLSAT